MSTDQAKRRARIEQAADPLARFMGRQDVNTAREAMEAGARLMVLKAMTPHGEWLPRLERLGISPRTAQKLMSCAHRFHQLPDAFFDAVGNAAKLYELLMLDEVQALAEGAEVYGVTLHTLRDMTAAELRQTLRGSRDADEAAVREFIRQRTLRLVHGVQPDTDVQDVEPINRSCDDLEDGMPELTVAEEILLRHWRQCDTQGRRALSDVACAMAVATLRGSR